MADKGLTIEDILPLGVSLNIPPFLGMDDQMSAEDVIATQEIASLRIHVERAINRVKNFQIFDGVIPLSLFGVVNQMWCMCAMLCNMQDPLISALRTIVTPLFYCPNKRDCDENETDSSKGNISLSLLRSRY